MTLGLLVVLENANRQTDINTRFMFYKYRYMYIRPALLYNKLVYSCYHLQGLQSRKVIMAIFEKQLLQKQQHMLDEEGEHDSEEDALSRLMRSDVKNQITVETLQELGLEMLFAGHITTASSLTSLLIHLAHNRYSTSLHLAPHTPSSQQVFHFLSPRYSYT